MKVFGLGSKILAIDIKIFCKDKNLKFESGINGTGSFGKGTKKATGRELRKLSFTTTVK